MARLHIGTSGWHYPDWVGRVYPFDAKPRDFLAHYAERFDTVEINNTFYGPPQIKTLAAWRERTPENFLFACKANRSITHELKLESAEAAAHAFLAGLEPLRPKLGPILFQLPPRLRADPARLETFLAALPAGNRYVFEFRDPSWFDDAVYAILRRHDAVLCAYDFAGRSAPLIETADFHYARLHGPHRQPYRGRYSDATLDAWAERIAGWLAAGRDVHCYFDNTVAGDAAKDAMRLCHRLEPWLHRSPSGPPEAEEPLLL